MSEETEDLPPDHITLARELLRRDPRMNANDLKDKLNLPNKSYALEVLRSAQQAEKDMIQKLQAESARADAMGDAPKVEQRVYVQDRETGIAHACEVLNETPRSVVLQIVDGAVKISKE